MYYLLGAAVLGAVLLGVINLIATARQVRDSESAREAIAHAQSHRGPEVHA